MSNNSNFGLTILGVSLGLAIIGSAYIIGDVVKKVKLSNQTIEVKGYAERSVLSDLAKWTFTVKAKDKNLDDANKQLKSDEKKVFSYLKKSNIDDSNIDISPTNTYERLKKSDDFSYETNEVEFYDVNRTFVVQMKDVYKLKNAAEKSSLLSEEGVNLQTDSLEYFSTDISSIKSELLGEATRNAVSRANQLAKNSDSKVGVLQNARQGVFQITSEYSTDVSDYGISDTRSINKKAKSVAAVTFAIKK